MAATFCCMEAGIFFRLDSRMIGFLSGFWGDFCADELDQLCGLIYNERVAPGSMNRPAVAGSTGPPL
jgi:hypothetical protein